MNRINTIPQAAHRPPDSPQVSQKTILVRVYANPSDVKGQTEFMFGGSGDRHG